MVLDNFNLIKIDKNNKSHIQFLKELFQNKDDKGMDYLGNLSSINDDNAYIVLNDKLERIGYFSMTSPVINHNGLNCSSLYYAISPKYRGVGYATKLLGEVSDYLLSDLDMLVLSIDKTNVASRKVALNNKFRVIFEDEEEDEILYAKSVEVKNKSYLR